ncbi:MAG: DNA alkylation repair protein [Thermomicrobiales bacterium]
MATHEDEIARSVGTVAGVRHGFSVHLAEANRLAAIQTPEERFDTARALLNDDRDTVRMLAVTLCETIQRENPPLAAEVLGWLRGTVSADPGWRVQEMLARAFDAHCAATGYEAVLPEIASWLGDERANVRRACSEGLRIWTSRPFFREHPEAAIRLLATLRADPSASVRKSAGNALRDISRKHPDLISAELTTWDLTDKATLETWKLASRSSREQGLLDSGGGS